MVPWIDSLIWEGIIEKEDYLKANPFIKLYMRILWFIVRKSGGELGERPW